MHRSCRRSRSPCSPSASAWSATASRAPLRASTGAHRDREQSTEPAVRVNGLRIEVAATGITTSSTTCRSRSAAARCWPSSASRDREDDRRARAARPRTARRPHRRRARARRRCGHVRSRQARTPRRARQAGLVRASGSRRRAQPGPPHRHAPDRSARGARLGWQRPATPRTHRRDDARGLAARRRGVPAPLPAPALGRPAATSQHRDGVRVPAGRRRPRRTDDRARRHDTGARTRDRPAHHIARGRRSAVRVARPVGRQQPRRPGRGDVCGTDSSSRAARPRSSLPPHIRTPGNCSPRCRGSTSRAA